MHNGEKISQQEFETIEKYILHELEETEKLQFEKRVESDPELKSKLEEIRNLILGVEAAGVVELMDEMHQELKPEKIQTADLKQEFYNNTSLIPYLIAASLVILVVVSAIWYINRPSWNERLFAEHFVPDSGIITPMSAHADYNFYAGMVDFKREEYALAIEKWKDLIITYPANDTLNYFMGVAHLGLKKSEDAIGFLQKATDKPNSAFIDEAWFYLGLAWLREGKTEEAIAALGNSNLTAAQNLLSELKNRD